MSEFFTGILIAVTSFFGGGDAPVDQAPTLGGPIVRLERTMLPETDSLYDLGTTTKAWREGWFDTLCFTADTCRTSWPSGSGGGSGTVGTSSVPVVGQLAYWTSAGFPSLLGSTPTTTLSGGSQIAVSNSPVVLGSSGAVLSVVADSIGDTQLAFNTGQTLTTVGTPTFATVDTGQGANELYDMNQNVQTGDSPTFAGLTLTPLTSALLVTNGSGVLAEYAGSNPCTNQVALSISALGVVGCTSVSNAMLSNSTISGVALGGTLNALTATNGSLTFSGSYDGSAARTVGLNVANANSWTALQSFANASTSLLSVTNTAYFGGTATTTIGSTGSITMPSGSTFTKTGVTDGCATWASGILGTTGTACGAGGGSSGGTWSTTTSQTAGQLVNYSNNTTDIVAIGSNSTTTAEFYFDPNLLVMSVGVGGAGDSSLVFGPNTSNQWITGYDETDKSYAIASSTVLGTLNALKIAKGGLLTFNSASSTLFSNTGTAWFGGTATSSFGTDGGLSFGTDGVKIIDYDSSASTIELREIGGTSEILRFGFETNGVNWTSGSGISLMNFAGMQLRGEQGTANNSGFGFVTDGNTGMFSSAVETIQFLTNGTQVLELKQSGATTTNLTVNGYASSTSLTVSNLNAASCDVKASTSGLLSCGTDATGAGGGGADFLYNQAIGFGVTGSATTTKTQFTLGIHASSTSQFDNATSTLLTATTAWITNLFIGVDTLAEYIADTAGAMWSGNTETGGAITYDDADNTLDFVCNTASGSVFGCLSTTDWTTFNNSVDTSLTITVAGTANQITSSAGAQDLSANRTWTLSLPNLVIFPSNASSTLFSTGYASSTVWRGGGLITDCDADAAALGWDLTLGQFVCGDDDSGGAASAGGSDTQIQFNDGGTTIGGASQLFWNKTTMKFGVGSSTPWALLSIASSSPTYLDPFFAVATSSRHDGNLFTIFATTSVSRQHASASVSTTTESGARVAIGAPTIINGRLQPLDQLSVDGRISSTWSTTECDYDSRGASLTADTINACRNWGFVEDTNANMVVTANAPDYYWKLQSSANTANDGAGMYTGQIGGGNWLLFNNSGFTPSALIVEGVVRINGAATGTAFYLGMPNEDPNSNGFESAPDNGCWFTASSTQANWKAVCADNGAYNILDTGIGSSTAIGGTGKFFHMRVEVSNVGTGGAGLAKFYLGNSPTKYEWEGQMTTNMPDNFAVFPMMHMGYTTATNATNREFHFKWLKFMRQRPLEVN